jgi:hypothetical protein
MNNYLAVAAISVVATTFIAAVVAYVLALGGHREIGALLFVSGAVAVLAASYVAEGHRVVCARLSMAVFAPSSVRPFAVALWGAAIAALGVFFQFEV